jgi:hypothetical protein
MILAIGAWLRCYHLSDIPFTYDEFSAIIRTHFSTFNELIDKGVRIDGHPAGVQVFLYYWIKIFGINEVIVKLPFIFCGLLAVWLIYRIGSEWFNSTVGLVAASFLSFLQYPVMYSQIARPYGSGLCFALLMVFFWNRLVFYPQNRKYLNVTGYILAGALCTYNHHFSLLFAFMVGVTGLLLCKRENIRSYLLVNLMILILYIPHLPIFFHQLSVGGIEGWLQKPRYDFIFDYLQYIFQFSVYVYLLVFLLISLALYWYEDKPVVKKKFLFISLGWFLIPYLAGFIYSKYVNSVLQYSVLIFSFPFLLFLLFGYFKTEKPVHKIVVVSLIAVIVIPSLVAGRKHYELFYHSPYREIVVVSKYLTDSLGAGNCAVILGTPEKINAYYLKKFHYSDLRYVSEDSLGVNGHIRSFLDNTKSAYLVYGTIPSSQWEHYALIIERFPYLIKHIMYCGGDLYLFSRYKPLKEKTEYFYEVVNDFETIRPEWINTDESNSKDSLPLNGTRSYWNIDTSEFSPTFFKPLRDLIRTGYDVVDVSVDVRIPQIFPGAWLVTSVTSGKKIISWRSIPVNTFVTPGHEGKAFISLRVSDIDLKHHALIFNAYIWNPMKLSYEMDDFTVRVRHDNPVIYGLYRPVEP